MVKTERFFITNMDIKLESEYYQSTSDKSYSVLLVHPHPQFLRI